MYLKNWKQYIWLNIHSSSINKENCIFISTHSHQTCTIIKKKPNANYDLLSDLYYIKSTMLWWFLLRKWKVNDVLDCKHKIYFLIDIRHISSYFQNVMEKYFFYITTGRLDGKKICKRFFPSFVLACNMRIDWMQWRSTPFIVNMLNTQRGFLEIVMDVNGPVILKTRLKIAAALIYTKIIRRQCENRSKMSDRRLRFL